MSQSRQTGRSAIALLAGFLAVVILSVGTDAAMHAIGVLPPMGQPATDMPMLIALIYRTIYGIVGGYIVARLAPHSPMKHALISGAVGFVLSTAGAVATWSLGTAFGPHWYPLALIATTMPAAWVGGKLFEIGEASGRIEKGVPK